jgi:hypothetical protein
LLPLKIVVKRLNIGILVKFVDYFIHCQTRIRQDKIRAKAQYFFGLKPFTVPPLLLAINAVKRNVVFPAQFPGIKSRRIYQSAALIVWTRTFGHFIEKFEGENYKKLL